MMRRSKREITAVEIARDAGIDPKLRQHVWAVAALMRAAPSWNAFQRSLKRAFQVRNDQYELRLGLDRIQDALYCCQIERTPGKRLIHLGF